MPRWRMAIEGCSRHGDMVIASVPPHALFDLPWIMSGRWLF
jgi:hypothetical protein